MNSRHFLKTAFLLLISLVSTKSSYSQLLFNASQSYSIGMYAAAVGAGDVNNDGLEDMVYAIGSSFGSPHQFKIFVCTQTAAGTLSNTSVYPYQQVYPGLKCMKISDVNHDGLNDVLIGYGDSIGIFFQNLSGTLNPIKSYFSGTDVDAISCGDLNNDGLTDIAVCHWNTSFIRVFYQNATSFTSSTYPKPNGGFDEIEIGDLNSDNLNDVVFVSTQNYFVHVFTQNASGQLNAYVSYTPTPNSGSIKDLAIGDLNNDGANDLVISRGGNSPNAGLLILFQNASGTLGTQQILPAYSIPEAIDITDFNCDGKPDIYTANGGSNTISIYEQDNNGIYNSYQLKFITSASHYNSSAMAIGDLDNDGRKDFVAISNTNKLNLLYNVSKPTNFADIDTLITVDTVYVHSQGFPYFYTNSYTDTLINKYVVKLDSFKVTHIHSSDSVRIDTFLYRSGQICGRPYEDTILNTHTYVHYYYERDTVLWSTTADTIYVGLHDLFISGSLKLYPNPTLGKIHLKFDPAIRRLADLLVEVFDHQGRRMRSFHLKEQDEAIDLSDYAEGTYFLNIPYEGKHFMYKVVKLK